MVYLSPRHRLIGLVLAVLLVLAGVTALLASVHREARESLVSRHFQRGQELAAAGNLAGAVEQYRAALTLERGQLEIERALGLTLLSLGRVSEAESYLRELLVRDPTSGPLNRGMARIHAARGREADARVFYHRAVYGEWPGDPVAGRLETRFELLDFLLEQEARDDALAELLQLKAELRPEQTAAVRRVADLLVQTGAPYTALDLLQAGAKAAPRDVELLVHLAARERELGRLAEAAATLRRAVALDPGRVDLKDRLAVSTRELALDPTLPRLRLSERMRRARQILAAVVAQTRPCIEGSESVEALALEARKHLARRAPTSAERAEEELALAARLWAAAPGCHQKTPEARALAAIVERIAAPESPAS